MSTNPLKNRQVVTENKTPQEHCDLGNARLRGSIPYSNGEFHPRDDIHWVVRNGSPTLEWKH